MRRQGRIIVRGIVQGVGFRPFVYAKAHELNINGTVKNLGSEVEILAKGDRFEDFVDAISHGPPLAQIDSIQVFDIQQQIGDKFTILPSGSGALTGMIPPDVAICDACIADIVFPVVRGAVSIRQYCVPATHQCH